MTGLNQKYSFTEDLISSIMRPVILTCFAYFKEKQQIQNSYNSKLDDHKQSLVVHILTP